MKRLFSAIALLLCLMVFAGTAVAANENATVTVSMRDAAGRYYSVELVSLGFTVSQVRLNGGLISVPTDDLSWETNAEGSKRVAYINAPRTGKAAFRKTEKPKSRIMDRVPANRLVLVVESGKKISGILYDGKMGYVQNSALIFPKKLDTPKMGVLVYNGSPDATKNINIRLKASSGSRKVASIPAGTVATVYKQTKNWSEIDAGGWHGYVLNEYVSLSEDPVPSSYEGNGASAPASPMIVGGGQITPGTTSDETDDTYPGEDGDETGGYVVPETNTAPAPGSTYDDGEYGGYVLPDDFEWDPNEEFET